MWTIIVILQVDKILDELTTGKVKTAPLLPEASIDLPEVGKDTIANDEEEEEEEEEDIQEMQSRLQALRS